MTKGIVERVPFTEDSAQYCTISIRICTDGFISFIVPPSSVERCDETMQIETTGLAPHPSTSSSPQHPFEVGEVAASITRYIECPSLVGKQLQEQFYEHPFLTYPYMSSTVYYRPDSFVLLPAGLENVDEKKWWKLTSSVGNGTEDYEVQNISIGEGAPNLLTGWNSSLRAFFLRTYPGVRLIPTVLPLIKDTLSCSRQSDRITVGVELFDHGMDLALCHRGQILFANAYTWPRSADKENHIQQILYFIAAISSHDFLNNILTEGYFLLLFDGECGTNLMIPQVKERLQTLLSINQNWRVENGRSDCESLFRLH